ncbi:MAG: aminopeptidase P family N-terminal domain-containing protein, partial [Chloroflexota bacterium]|nr:aminopeptidase P family N-terminal domain-containing protein [Chloroflexota bacterium]
MTDARVEALRALLDEHRLDAMLVSRAANKRYFSGLRLGPDEEATWPGSLLVTRDARLVLADSRYTEQAEREAPGWEVVLTTGGIADDLPPILLEREIVALGMEAAVVTHAEWSGLAEAAPGTELHAMDDEIAPLRLRKSTEEVDAIGRACA